MRLYNTTRRTHAGCITKVPLQPHATRAKNILQTRVHNTNANSKTETVPQTQQPVPEQPPPNTKPPFIEVKFKLSSIPHIDRTEPIVRRSIQLTIQNKKCATTVQALTNWVLLEKLDAMANAMYNKKLHKWE